MPDKDPNFFSTEHPRLTEQIRRVLKGGTIRATRLPLTPGIQLYLLDENYPRHSLTREEILALMNEPPFWAFCWSSGQVLAKWVVEHKELVEGLRVLDFGTGSGIVAVAAAGCGAREVLACDIDPVSLEAVKANAELNQVNISVSKDFESAAVEDFDLILAADVLYDADIFPFVKRLAESAADVILADSRVRDLTLDPYRKIGQGQAVTCPDLQEPEEYRQVSIYRTIRKIAATRSERFRHGAHLRSMNSDYA